MAKRRRGEQRPFRPEVLEPFADPHLLPPLLPGRRIWRYTVTVPIEQFKPTRKPKASPGDRNLLRRMFVRHFGGVTLPTSSLGYGLRDPEHPEQAPESNYNAYFVVLASPGAAANRYFRALRTELQDALDEGVILIERHVVWIPRVGFERRSTPSPCGSTVLILSNTSTGKKLMARPPPRR